MPAVRYAATRNGEDIGFITYLDGWFEPHVDGWLIPAEPVALGTRVDVEFPDE